MMTDKPRYSIAKSQSRIDYVPSSKRRQNEPFPAIECTFSSPWDFERVIVWGYRGRALNMDEDGLWNVSELHKPLRANSMVKHMRSVRTRKNSSSVTIKRYLTGHDVCGATSFVVRGAPPQKLSTVR